MKSLQSFILLCILFDACFVISNKPETERLINEPGHLKPFGYSENHLKIKMSEGFLFPREFHENHMLESKPLLMKNAAKLSKAFSRWTDEYFLSLDEPSDSSVLIEAKKKENRTAPATMMSFKEYVRIYNHTDQYLVNTVPSFIASDVLLPGPLQCEEFQDVLVDTVMWFSSGGTKSVVHTDSVDNINCLIRGRKTLIMVDPHKYGDKVDLDRPEGSYSDVDVEKVDFTKYPGLAEVEYYKVDMEAGDCLYIPYQWVHNVASVGSNVAVNVWWDHQKGQKVDIGQCPDVFDPDFTLDQVKISGFGDQDLTVDMLKEELLTRAKKGPFDLEEFIKIIVTGYDDIDEMFPEKEYEAPLQDMFAVLDQNKDYSVSHDEIANTSDEDWDNLAQYLGDFNDLMGDMPEETTANTDSYGRPLPPKDTKDEL